MRAHIHIGMQKTGTTAIQHFLHQNRDLLLHRQGCLYPVSVQGWTVNGHDHNPLVIRPLAESWQRLQAELKNTDPPHSVF